LSRAHLSISLLAAEHDADAAALFVADGERTLRHRGLPADA
jgi:hypothetical protein